MLASFVLFSSERCKDCRHFALAIVLPAVRMVEGALPLGPRGRDGDRAGAKVSCLARGASYVLYRWDLACRDAGGALGVGP